MSDTSFMVEIKQSINTAWRLLPRLFRNPLKSFEEITKEFPDKNLIYISSAITLILSLALVAIVYIKFGQLAHSLPNKMTVFLKVILVLEVPFVALAAANFAFQKALGGDRQAGIGVEMLGSAVSLLPTYLAGIACSIVGVGNIELIIFLGAYGVVSSTLLTYELSRQQNQNKANILLFLAPVKIMAAAYLTKVICVTLAHGLL